MVLMLLASSMSGFLNVFLRWAGLTKNAVADRDVGGAHSVAGGSSFLPVCTPRSPLHTLSFEEQEEEDHLLHSLEEQHEESSDAQKNDINKLNSCPISTSDVIAQGLSPGSVETDGGKNKVGECSSVTGSGSFPANDASEQHPAIATETESTDKDAKKRQGFPDSLEGFGYHFNSGGRLVSLADGDSGFVFEVRKNDKQYNQKHYEALGEVIDNEVYKLLEVRCGLKRHAIPFDAEPNEPRSFFFVSEDALNNTDKLIVLIHGSGVVRAGQWSRRLIINDGLDQGSQIPFIERALKLNYSVVVMNTNYHASKSVHAKIKGSSSPEMHGNYIWKHFISKCPAKRIAIIAHSAGGYVTSSIANDHLQDFLNRVFAVAFTDAFPGPLNPKLKNHFRKTCVNWVTHEKPLNAHLFSNTDYERRSAGTTVHEWTSYCAFDAIFEFIDSKYKAISGKRPLPSALSPHKAQKKNSQSNGETHHTNGTPVNGSQNASADKAVENGTEQLLPTELNEGP